MDGAAVGLGAGVHDAVKVVETGAPVTEIMMVTGIADGTTGSLLTIHELVVERLGAGDFELREPLSEGVAVLGADPLAVIVLELDGVIKLDPAPLVLDHDVGPPVVFVVLDFGVAASEDDALRVELERDDALAEAVGDTTIIPTTTGDC